MSDTFDAAEFATPAPEDAAPEVVAATFVVPVMDTPEEQVVAHEEVRDQMMQEIETHRQAHDLIAARLAERGIGLMELFEFWDAGHPTK